MIKRKSSHASEVWEIKKKKNPKNFWSLKTVSLRFHKVLTKFHFNRKGLDILYNLLFIFLFLVFLCIQKISQ